MMDCFLHSLAKMCWIVNLCPKGNHNLTLWHQKAWQMSSVITRVATIDRGDTRINKKLT